MDFVVLNTSHACACHSQPSIDTFSQYSIRDGDFSLQALMTLGARNSQFIVFKQCEKSLYCLPVIHSLLREQ